MLGALTALTPASIDMYLPSFPELGRALGATPGAVQLTLSAYLIGLMLGQALYGPLADQLGRRGPLAAGLALYALASVGCAVAPHVEALIALRFVQALGGAACLVVPRAMVRDLFDAQASARVYSHLMLVMGVAPILAPLLGGQIVLFVGWRGIFALLAALGAAGLLATLGALPETRPRVTLGAPLADYGRLLADRVFLRFALSGALAMAGMFAYIAESPFVLIELYGIPAQAYGWVFGANATGLIAASQLNGRLLVSLRAERILAGALQAMALLGLVLLVVAATGAGGLAALLCLLFGYMASRGFVQPNAVACALAHHPERAGSGSALVGVLQFAAATGASALVGALHDGTARPMTAVMALCGVLALTAHATRRARRLGV